MIVRRGHEDPSLAHLAAVVESSLDAIFTHTLDGIILTWNRAAERTYGYPAEEAIGRSITMLVPEGSPDETADILTRLERGEQLVQYETLWQRKDGRRIDVSLTISPIADRSGTVVAGSIIGRDITERKQAEEALRRLNADLQHKAYHDTLTGLPNRALFSEHLRQALARARRYGTRVAVFLIDINGFKRINDTFGHLVGDGALVEVARRLRTQMRQTDTVARWGGDEFSAVLGDVRTAEDAAGAARRVIGAFQTPVLLGGREHHVTVTIGISLYPTDAEAPDELLRRADHAMYQAVARGEKENTFVFFGTVQ